MRVGGKKTVPDGRAGKRGPPGSTSASVGLDDIADLRVGGRYIAAISAGMVLTGVGAGLWLGVGAGLFCVGLLLVLVPYSASLQLLRIAVDAFGPAASPNAREETR